MKTYLLFVALGAAIGVVGNVYRISGSKNETPDAIKRRKVQAIFVVVGAVVFIYGAIGVIVSWN